MKIILQLLVMFSFLGLAGCAAMQQDWQQQNCNPTAAYEKGMNEAREGQRMDSSYASACPPETQGQMQAGYQQGYTAGINSLPPPPPIGYPTQGAPPVVIIQGNAPPSPNAWFCELTAFNQSFHSFGATQLEAQEGAIHRCLGRYSGMFCQNARCRPNQ